METLQKKKYEKPRIRFVTDIDVILECLHEVYGLEREQVLSGKNIHCTMIYPFIKMLENQCEGISAEGLHEILWKIYVQNSEIAVFLEEAEITLKSYLQEEKTRDHAEEPIYKT